MDHFGRIHTYLRISVTDRCNLRCTYCMPASRIPQRNHEDILTFEEIERLVRLMAGMGVRKVRLTGGEPLVRRDLPDLIARLHDLGLLDTLAMTTNGVLLDKFLPSLFKAGLNQLNISLDTLRPERFHQITGYPLHERVLAGIHAAVELGFIPLKLNVVVMGGFNDDELLDFVELVREQPIQVRFIEYMPFQINHWEATQFISYQQMFRRLTQHYQLVSVDPFEDISHVARVFSIEGYCGTVGFITSVSDHFCHLCNRLRLMADGSLKTCLFDYPEINLRSLLRSGLSDEEIIPQIRRAVSRKQIERPSLERLMSQNYQCMFEIGG